MKLILVHRRVARLRKLFWIQGFPVIRWNKLLATNLLTRLCTSFFLCLVLWSNLLLFQWINNSAYLATFVSGYQHLNWNPNRILQNLVVQTLEYCGLFACLLWEFPSSYGECRTKARSPKSFMEANIS